MPEMTVIVSLLSQMQNKFIKSKLQEKGFWERAVIPKSVLGNPKFKHIYTLSLVKVLDVWKNWSHIGLKFNDVCCRIRVLTASFNFAHYIKMDREFSHNLQIYRHDEYFFLLRQEEPK